MGPRRTGLAASGGDSLCWLASAATRRSPARRSSLGSRKLGPCRRACSIRGENQSGDTQCHGDTRAGAKGDAIPKGSRFRRRWNRHGARAPGFDARSRPLRPSGLGAARRESHERQSGESPRQLALSRCYGVVRRELAAGVLAVLPVAGRMPRLCRGRGSFAPQPRFRPNGVFARMLISPTACST